MNWFKDKLETQQRLLGCWVTSGSSMVTELLAGVGFDWLLLDTEHGPDDYATMLSQLQACKGTKVSPIVRIPDNKPRFYKRALDLGAAGIMTPNVNSAEEASAAVKYMKYPPDGTRGVSSSVRVGDYGLNFSDYFSRANSELVCIVQIETRDALKNVDAIAAVEGVDVIFLGPSDLSVNMGIPFQTDRTEFKAAYDTFLSACKKYNKHAGIIVKSHQDIECVLNDGFKFVAVGSDMGFMRKQAEQLINTVNR